MLLDNASFGANSPVVSRSTHVMPQWKVSHHVAPSGVQLLMATVNLQLIKYIEREQSIELWDKM